MTDLVPGPPAGALPSRRIFWLAFAAVLLVAAILRLHALSSLSLWLDEAVSWDQARQPFLHMIRRTAADNYPPLHNTILHVAILALGDSEFALRLPSALLGIAGVAAIFWVGALIDGPAAGFLSAALLALSGFHIHFSQEARPYALLTLTATLFAGTAVRALETDRRGWHAASAVAALLLLNSHAYGSLLWLSLVAAVFASAKAFHDPAPGTLVTWTLWQSVAALLFLPWAGILAVHYERIVVTGFWIQKPDAAYLLSIVENLASGGAMALGLAAGVVASLALPPCSNGTAGGHGDRPKSHLALRRTLLVAWLLGPLLLGLAASLISQPILYDKYVIGSLPAWLILASSGICRLCQARRIGILILAIGAAAVNLWFYEPPGHEDVRAAVEAYAAQAQPADCVILFHGYMDAPVLYYLRRKPACFLRADEPSDVRPWQLAPPRAWLFLGHVDAGQRRAVVRDLQVHGWRARSVAGGPGTNMAGIELLTVERAR